MSSAAMITNKLFDYKRFTNTNRTNRTEKTGICCTNLVQNMYIRLLVIGLIRAEVEQPGAEIVQIQATHARLLEGPQR